MLRCCCWISLIVLASDSASTFILRAARHGDGDGSNAGFSGLGLAAHGDRSSPATMAMRGGVGYSASGVRRGGGAFEDSDVRREAALDAELAGTEDMSGERDSGLRRRRRRELRRWQSSLSAAATATPVSIVRARGWGLTAWRGEPRRSSRPSDEEDVMGDGALPGARGC